MANMIGTGADQVPTNGMLCTLAWQDHRAVNIEGGKIGGVDVATIASIVLTGEQQDTINSSTNLTLRGGGVNLLTYSEQFDNAAWSKTRATVTANALAAPDGALTADKLVEDATASNTHYVGQSFSFISGTTYTASFYAKQAERVHVQPVFLSTSFGATTGPVISLSTGERTSGSGSYTYTSQPIGNGWYRITVTATATATASSEFQVRTVANGVTSVYTGDGTSGVYIWGAQLVPGTSPGPYTKTVATAITTAAPALIDAPNGKVEALAASITPPRNGDLAIEATSNTTLTFKLRGTDGTVRSATLTLT